MKHRIQWKPVIGFEAYEVSNTGRVRRADNKRPIQRQKSHSRGHMIQLSSGGVRSTLRLARIVGATFCPDYREDRYPLFRNGDSSDYRARNLKWVPRSEIAGAPYSKNPRN